MKSNLVLTGFMGTGKTTAGKLAAKDLNMQFIDTDYIIEKQEGIKISQIFSEKGEKYFRDVESCVIKKVSTYENCIISTGGGVALCKENIRLLRKKGIIVLLKSNVKSIINNISHKSDRPLLNSENREGKMKELLKQREEYYSDNDYEIDGSYLNIYELTDSIVKVWRIYKNEN